MQLYNILAFSNLYLNSDYMTEETNLIVNNSKIVSTFFNLVMHQFIKLNKRKVAEGNCLVLQYQPSETSPAQYYIKMNNVDTLKLVNNSLFFKMIYAKSTSYLFFDPSNNEVVYAISGLNNSVDLEIMEALFKKQAILQQYGITLPYQVKVRIDYHADNIAENEIIVNFNKSTKFAKYIGSYFGVLEKTITKKTNQTQKIIQQKIQQITKQRFSQQTFQKWNNLKAKASQWNEKMIDIVRPVNQRIQNFATDMGQKYNGATNQYIVTFRQFSKETTHALNEAVRTQIIFDEPQQQAQINHNASNPTPNKQEEPSEMEMSNPYPVLNETL